MDLSKHFENQDFLRELVERAELGDDEAAVMLKSVFVRTLLTSSTHSVAFIGRTILNSINTLLQKDVESN